MNGHPISGLSGPNDSNSSGATSTMGSTSGSNAGGPSRKRSKPLLEDSGSINHVNMGSSPSSSSSWSRSASGSGSGVSSGVEVYDNNKQGSSGGVVMAHAVENARPL